MKQEAVISSAANPTVKWLRSLALRKNREAEGVFIIEGARDVAAAVQAGWQLNTLVTKDIAPVDLSAPRLLRVTADLMSRIVNRDNAQDTLGVFRQQWADTTQCGRGLWLALEDIRDPGNLGTIIRTCDAVSAAGVILIGNTCDPFAPETVKATVGSLPHVPLLRFQRDAFIDWRTTYERPVLGTHLAGAVDYRTAGYAEDCILIMGSESAGLSDALTNICTAKIKIPMSGQAESLNVAVAAAVVLYEAKRAQL